MEEWAASRVAYKLVTNVEMTRNSWMEQVIKTKARNLIQNLKDDLAHKNKHPVSTTIK